MQTVAVASLAMVFCSGPAVADVPLYKVFETTVTNLNSYGNKFIDVELEAEFTSPSGETKLWRGFYDGNGRGGGDYQTGSIWRLRFMPDEVGTWNYVYTWSDGTPGGSGSFDCVADGAGKGVIRAYRDNPRWFAYRGTEPVFLKSYQLYYEGLLHHDIDWTVSRVYQKMVDAGYNHLQIYLLPTSWYESKAWKFADAPATVSHDHLFIGDNPSRTMDLLVCHNLDKHMAWLNDHDIGLLGHQGFDGNAAGPRFHDLSSTEQEFYIKYVCARLAPYANICGWNYTWETRGDGPELIWAELIMKYDPWSHLRSYHDRWPDSGPEGDAGHHFADSRYSLANIENHTQDHSHPGSHDPSTHHRVTLSAYAKKPVFMSEGNGLWRWFWGAKEDEIHRNAWAVTTAGGSFCWTDHTEGGSSSTIFSWPEVKNRIDYLTHIMTEDVKFYTMEPHDELLTRVASEATCYCLAEIGQQYLVYKEDGGSFELHLAPGQYTATWIDSRTNNRQSAGNVTRTGGRVNFSVPDNSTEWLLLLQSKSQPSVDTASSTVHAERPNNLSRIEVSENSRFLVTEGGEPFFYLADTAWELFHRLNREEADRYLSDRAAKGFNVIQAVALAEQTGLTDPNAYGHVPLIVKTDPTRPAIKPGPKNDYWDHVDEVIDLAAEKKLYVGLLPTWGRYVTSHWANGIVDGIFTVENAQKYGEFIGRRYRDRRNIIWIIGGDRAAPTKESQAIWRAMAKGVAVGVSGRDDDSKVLMTYHTSGPGHASDFFHDDQWLDFTSIQSGHGIGISNWMMIERDYNRRPIKPTIDLETTYVQIHGASDDHARRSAYLSVFAGACGHTYGHNAIWQMYAPNRPIHFKVKSYWYDSLDAPSAHQMGHLRKLMESRPFLSRVPDQSLIASDPGKGIGRLQATRGDGYAFVYAPMGRTFRVQLGSIAGERVKAWWFDPRTGKPSPIGSVPNRGEREFDPPGEPAVGNDWVLVLDDAARAFSSPGDTNATKDKQGQER